MPKRAVLTLVELDPVDRLVARAAGLTWDDLSPQVRHQAARVLADTVGVMLGGAAEPEIRALVQIEDDGTEPGGSVTGRRAQVLTPDRPWTTTAEAALVNGTAAVVLELDECAAGNGGHAAAHVVPVALAVAQAHRRSGAELLTAIVAGYEVVARLGQTHRWDDAVHGHGHVGTVGAALAVAMLSGSDVRNAVRAASIAGNLPLATVQQACLDGATVRDAWVGASGSLALVAHRLAGAGFTGSASARSVALGEVLGKESSDGTARAGLGAPLAEPFAVQRNSVKFHSACFETHSALEAALRQGVLTESAIAEVVVEMPASHLATLPNGTPLSNRFSVPYGVAAALIHGHTGPAAFTLDERVMALAHRIRVVQNEVLELDREGPDSDPARVTVVRVDGVIATTSCALPRGHWPDRPDDAALATKFASVSGFSEPEMLFARLLEIGDRDDVSTLFEGIA